MHAGNQEQAARRYNLVDVVKRHSSSSKNKEK